MCNQFIDPEERKHTISHFSLQIFHLQICLIPTANTVPFQVKNMKIIHFGSFYKNPINHIIV